MVNCVYCVFCDTIINSCETELHINCREFHLYYLDETIRKLEKQLKFYRSKRYLLEVNQ